MTVGDRIRQRREELGLTQEELGRMIGYKNRSSINKIELNLQQLRQQKVAEIARALNTTATWILGIEDEEQEVCEKFAECYGSGTADIVDKLLRLDEGDRILLDGILETMLKADKYLKRDTEGRVS